MSKNSPLLQPVQVGNLTFKNRIMFPPLTTGYEERDGSIGARSLAFYERLAKGGAAFVVIGDVAPVMTASLHGSLTSSLTILQILMKSPEMGTRMQRQRGFSSFLGLCQILIRSWTCEPMLISMADLP